MYELRKENLSLTRWIWQGINSILFCRSLLESTFSREIKKRQLCMIFKAKHEKIGNFSCTCVYVDKYHRRIQNPVSFNGFKLLAICVRNYPLEAWLVSAHHSKNVIWIYWWFYWCILIFFGSCCLLVLILNFEPTINKVLIIMIITNTLGIVKLSYLLYCCCFTQIAGFQNSWFFLHSIANFLKN